MKASTWFITLLAVGSSVTASTSLAQCEPSWLPDLGVAGADSWVGGMVRTDWDGAGPRGVETAIFGRFSRLGQLSIQGAAAFDATTNTWTQIGGGFSTGDIRSANVLSDGAIYVTGQSIRLPGSSTLWSIIKWDGTSWQGIPNSPIFLVYDVALLADGRLIAVGLGSSDIAVWNGATWTAMTTGLIESSLDALAVHVRADGTLLVAGRFNGTTMARWNGTSWVAVPGAPTSNYATDMVELSDGTLGLIGAIGTTTQRSFFRWDGTTFTGMNIPVPINPNVARRLVEPVPGEFILVGTSILRFRTGVWQSIGGVAGQLGAIAAEVSGDGRVFVGGDFSAVGNLPARAVAALSDSGPEGLFDGIISAPTNLNRLADGRIVSLQMSLVVDGQSLRGPAEWRNGRWNQWLVPPGISPRAVAELPNGAIVFGGIATSTPANTVAVWNGATWETLGAGPSGSVFDIAVLPSGLPVVVRTLTGSFPRAEAWNGSEWTPIGTASLVCVAGGVLYGVWNDTFSTQLFRWDGSTWQANPVYIDNTISSLEAGLNNELIIAGRFTRLGSPQLRYLATYDGNTFSPLGNPNGPVNSVSVVPGREMIIGGEFTSVGGISANRIARWDGELWSTFGSGANSTVQNLVHNADGILAASGTFTTMDNTPQQNFAIRDRPCIPCDSIDFNQNTVFPEDQDVIDFFNVLAGGECSPGNTCSDIDFNNNTVFPEDHDVIDFFTVLAGGECP